MHLVWAIIIFSMWVIGYWLICVFIGIAQGIARFVKGGMK